MPYIHCNGADIYYEDLGWGQPIVFMHGVMAGLRFFQPQLDGLSNDYRTIAFDFRGHGRSSKTEMGHTLPQYARDLHTLLERLELEDVVLVGWSMGALVSWEYVKQYGNHRLKALVDVDMEVTRFKWEDYEYGTSDLDNLRDTLMAFQTDHIELIQEITEPLLMHPPSPSTRKLIMDELSRTPPPIKCAILFDCTFRDYREMLSKLDIPILVMAGADDKWRPIVNVKNVLKYAPHARFELFEESGHILSIEEPEKFNNVLKDFIKSLPQK
jgi:pimeloyl-ACP methyl ester carboxylesterase